MKKYVGYDKDYEVIDYSVDYFDGEYFRELIKASMWGASKRASP